MFVPRPRIEALLKIQCKIYNQSYNPSLQRTGNKVLRQRLRGAAMASYYPSKPPTLRTLEDMFPDLETWSDEEVDRDEGIALRKARGKGAPRKKRTAEESKKFGKKKSTIAAGNPET